MLVDCTIYSLILRLLFPILAVRIVNEAIFLKKVSASGFFLLGIILSERIVLDVNLSLGSSKAISVDAHANFLLNHGYEPDQLRSLHLFWIEVIGFSNVKVANEIISIFCNEQVAIEHNVVVKLLVASLRKVIDNGQLRRVVLDH